MKQKNFDCSVCANFPNSIFFGVNKSILGRLHQEKRIQNYQPGQIITLEGSPSFAMYCIHSGRVKLYKVGKKMEPLVIRLLVPGDTIGCSGVLSNAPYFATSEAIEPTTVCTISKQTLFELLRKSDNFALRLLERMAQELHTSDELMLVLTQESVRQRTARLLLYLLEKSGEESKTGGPLKVPIFRKEMAQMIGTTPETMSRTLRYFAQHGILRLTRSEIYIENPHILQTLTST
jgi:CRP-like cAMP-binding protein